ncbi:uncharacterized protein BDR25DRAFT_196051, partial [Lindgomyces ingoldianus]
MASPASKPVSNLAAAFAGQSPSANIPIPREGGHVSAPDRPNMLLTPPNSISPTLPPHKHRPGIATTVASPPPVLLDSDIDLQDAVEHAAAQDQPSALSREALAAVESSGQITPAMLAKYHLPGILSNETPQAIRFVLQALNEEVPGFSRIQPAKARRLVVAALENRAGGGVNGEIEFEKVGWGKWKCRRKGQPSRNVHAVPIGAHGPPRSGPSPPASMDSAGGLQVPRNTSRDHRDMYSTSWGADSAMSSRDEDMAEGMSLDGSESDSSDMDLEDDLDDDTDMEDMSNFRPDELSLDHGSYTEIRDYNYLSRTSGARFRSASAQAAGIPIG